MCKPRGLFLLLLAGLVLEVGQIFPSFAEGDAPYPVPNESGKTVFSSIADLFNNAGTAVSKELSKLSDSIRSQLELTRYEKMAPAYAKKYRDEVAAAATHFSIPEPFLACLINKESSFEARALSPRGAMGIMQFMRRSIIEFNRQIRRDDYSKAAWGTYPFKSGKVPSHLSLTDVWNPEVMIPAGALRFKTRALLLFGEFGATNWTLAQAMILVADYDMGPEGLSSVCKFKSPRDSRDPPPLDRDTAVDACINSLNPALNQNFRPLVLANAWEEIKNVSSCMVGMPNQAEDRKPSATIEERKPSATIEERKPSAFGRMLKKNF